MQLHTTLSSKFNDIKNLMSKCKIYTGYKILQREIQRTS